MPVQSLVKSREYHRRSYQRHRPERDAQRIARRRLAIQWMRDLKASRGCQQCPETHPAALDFHHRDGEEKDRAIADMAAQGVSRERILVEIAKCDVLCANCHRKGHDSEEGGEVNV